MTALAARNLLADENSPYLLRHKDDPVHWRPWGQAALDEAKALNKPVLLALGYNACHWCHVMHQESFLDAETAAQLNRDFVCIILDREERPDVDMIYQTSVQALGQAGGWPLLVFLSPEGLCFTGTSYLPPEERDGRPSLRTMLTQISAALNDRPDDIQKATRDVRDALERVWNTDAPLGVDANIVEPVSRRITQRIDLFWGGYEGAPKFPQTAALNLVWHAFMRTAAPQFGNAVTLSLDNMAQGGIFDHLGGGYARYSTDERWLVPHFEKMLYDNACLVELMTLVWQMTRSPLYASRIDETIDWVLREMVTKDGAFASSQDSDSDGEEGGYYTWSEAEIDEVLGPNDAPMFKQVYGVTPNGNWQGKNILHRLGAMGFLRPDQEAVLTRCRRMLQMARAKRSRPALDDKALTDWNGMMIAALVQAGAVFRKPEWHFAAIRAFWAIDEKLGENGVLYHAWRDGRRSQFETTAEGYAQMTRAALHLFEMSADQRYLERAKTWTSRLETKFRDILRGGYYLTSSDTTDTVIRVRTALDQSTPNYNGVIVENLARLFFLTREQSYRDNATTDVNAFGAEVLRQAQNVATFLNAIEFTIAAPQIIILGDERAPETMALMRAVLERSVPCRVMSVLKPTQKLPVGHPAFGKSQLNGKPTAYLCIGEQCSEAITDPNVLASMLLPVPFQVQAQLLAQQQQALQQRTGSAANNR